MKKTLLFVVAFLFAFSFANAQQRTKLQEGIYLVMYGDKLIIEDDIHGQSLSMEVRQEIVDYQNQKVMYTVICGKYTKKVFQEGLKRAIEAGFAAAGSSAGLTLAGAVVAYAAEKGYDYMCKRWGEKFDD